MPLALRIFLPVTGPRPTPPDVEVADLPEGNRTKLVVQNEELLARAGLPDRDRLPRVGRRLVDAVVAARNRCLRRPVEIRERRLRNSLHPVSESRVRHDLTAPDDPAQATLRVVSHGVVRRQQRHHRRDGKPLRQPGAPNELREFRRKQVELRWDEVKFCARGERPIDVKG